MNCFLWSSVQAVFTPPGASVRREEVVQTKAFTDVRSDVFVLRQTRDIRSLNTEKPSSDSQPRTRSTRLSRKGTSFSNSLSFLSMNQLSMGIPLESWKTNNALWCHTHATRTHGGRQAVCYLIGEGLRWVVDDDGLGEIPTQDVQVFDVIPLDADAVLTEQPVPEGDSEGTVRGWNVTLWTQVWSHWPDQLLPWIQNVQ